MSFPEMSEQRRSSTARLFIIKAKVQYKLSIYIIWYIHVKKSIVSERKVNTLDSGCI